MAARLGKIRNPKSAIRNPQSVLLLIFLLALRAAGQTALGLENGTLDFATPDFSLKILKSSQTVVALEPKGAGGFDFTPADRLDKRAANGFYHLGDLRFSLRVRGAADWRDFSTAAERQPVTGLPATAPDLAVADLSPTLPADCPLRVVRRWTLDGGRLVLNFELTNKTNEILELGAIGIPLPFNNILTDRSLAELHEKCSFSDPYTGADAGYLRVTRLKGDGPALVVVPEGKTPFEAYQLLPEPMRTGQTFEGTFEWLAHSRAPAETLWKNAVPWNAPTSEQLAPRAARTFGLKFLVAPEIRKIEDTLAANKRPVAVGIPGYILPADVDGKLFLKYGAKVKSLTVEPQNALTATPGKILNGWQPLAIRPKGWGRARLTIDYADGTRQTVHYYLTKPAAAAVDDLGRFLFTRQWYENPDDPFKRSPSVISYDRETDRPVEQDNRVWIAGLGDEGGAGSWLAAAMKEEIRPRRDEIAKYERFVDGVLWGRLQYADGPLKYGVRKSLFYYAPAEFPNFAYDPAFNWTTWASWKKEQAESVGRGYDYPHVVAAYLALYRLARNHPGLVGNHPWQWYLERAFETTRFMFGRKADGTRRVEYVELGLMEGSVFPALLDELKRENLKNQADEIEVLMRERAEAWNREEYPFGSEMAWDSTGQEEIYAWCRYFGFDAKARVALNSILGYLPAIPHWGYNGNSRRYWDFLYAGKLRRIERQLHHYGSGLNAIPVLADFRAHPRDFYLLRIGYGGATGALSNIDREGFASVAFHSFPDTLRWDAYSGDYGPNFFGCATNAATYVVDHPDFGWQAFGGNIAISGNIVTVTPLDAARRRLYIAPFGLWLTLDAGRFRSVVLDKRAKTLKIILDGADEFTKTAFLRIERPAKIDGVGDFRPVDDLKTERGAFIVPLGAAGRQIVLRPGG
ncbi:MAG: hypothetical protein JSS81_02980 [Acidobacteria bacterium]|nr:hypothetical protein [Acidobacteriota bacterium]